MNGNRITDYGLPITDNHQGVFVNFLDTILLGNTLKDWGLALLIAVVAIIAFPTIRRMVVRRVADFAKTTETDWDNFIGDLLSRTRGWFFADSGAFILAHWC